MLHIYYGRENIDRAAHLFDHLEANGILVVPEQYTLRGEGELLAYLGTEGLLGMEVLSFSSLGRNILQEAGGAKRPTIGRYGRQMLLANILGKVKNDLVLYGKYTENTDFITMINDMISQMKQYDVTPELLGEAAETVQEGHGHLREKLQELALIFGKYEEAIQGRYVDTEDRINLYCEKLPNCDSLANRQINVRGFDYFTPGNLKLLGALMSHCQEVNVYLTYGDEVEDETLFALGTLMIGALRDLAKERGVDFAVEKIGKDYAIEDKTPALAHLERELYRIPPGPTEEQDGIHMMRAANFYNEAVAAALEIRRLVTEEGYRYRDMVLICNDLAQRGSVYKRVFGDFGLDLYLDEKKSVLHHPAVTYVLHLLAAVTSGYRSRDVLAMLKTGLAGLDDERVARLEIYAEEYRIQGSRWKNPFEKGAMDLGEEALAALEETRRQIMEPLLGFAEAFKEAKTMEEKTKVLYRYLEEDLDLPSRLMELIDEQLAAGEQELAAETAQIWNTLLEILDQMVAVGGDTPIAMVTFSDMLRTGLESVELGLLPPQADGLSMGTMERTRTGACRAIFVLGANEGVLPLSPESKELLSEDEKEYLLSQDLTLCKMDRLRAMEENLAIYRNLTQAKERLWVSFAAADQEGNKLEASSLCLTLQELYPNLVVEQDSLAGAGADRQIGGQNTTLHLLGQALMQQQRTGLPLSPAMEAAANWYREHEPTKWQGLTEALTYRNTAEPFGRERAKDLYLRNGSEELSLSPSRLERFGGCPFAHFIRYGLRPTEPSSYEVQSFDMGNVYHRLLRDMADRLTRHGVAITDPASPWMTISDGDREAMVDEILDQNFAKYREGLLQNGGAETYRARRIRQVAQTTARMVVDQVRAGQITAMDFEVPFGRGRAMEPLSFETAAGDTILVEGTVDRVDQLAKGGVKVIDYKSGNTKYNEQEATSGWRLQLFLYLDAATSPTALENLTVSRDKEPIGAFYFHVDSPVIDESKISETAVQKAGGFEQVLEKKLREEFRLSGVMVDREDVIEDIAGEEPETSNVLAVKKPKQVDTPEGPQVKRESLAELALLNEEEFHALIGKVNDRVRQMGTEILDGHMDIAPRKSKKRSACTYCDYKHICKFDTQFADCRFVPIDR